MSSHHHLLIAKTVARSDHTSHSTMNHSFQQTLCSTTGASVCFEIEVIQNLWSGYGKIARYGLTESDHETVVVKHVRLPENSCHPRGWDSDRSHERKVRSYQVEVAWYEQWSLRCDETCRVPRFLLLEAQGDDVLMVLEDLDDSGFAERRSTVNDEELHAGLSWLRHEGRGLLHWQLPEG